MISFEARNFILKLILLFLYTNRVNGCDSNRKLYTEIGCNPVYKNGSSSCPVAYDCEEVFTRPSDKCYFNGNVYKPGERLSRAVQALDPCLDLCSCELDRFNNNNKTVAILMYFEVCCWPRYFSKSTSMKSCYYQFDKDSCCPINMHCPEANEVVHECVYGNKTYKDGQKIYVGDYFKCVCSPDFNGTISDRFCRKTICKYEIKYMKNILKRSAPVYFEEADGCPLHWYDPDYNGATAVQTAADSTSSSHECKYGDISFAVGQQVAIDEDPMWKPYPYSTTCSCNTPPLLTCIKTKKQNV